jgi:hypothetical protein
MNDKFLFVFSHSTQIDWYSIFATGFKELGDNFKTVIFVHGKDDAERALRYDCYDIVIDLLEGLTIDQGIGRCEIKVSERIVELEKKLSKSFFWEDIKTDRWARESSSNLVLHSLNHATDILTKAYDKYAPIAGIGEYTMALYRYAHHLLDSDGKVMFYPVTTRYFNRLYFETDLDWKWADCIDKYRFFLNNNIPDDIYSVIKPLYLKLSGERNAKPIYTIHETKSAVGYVSIRELSLVQFWHKLAGILTRKRRIDERNIRNSYVEKNVFQAVKRMVLERLNHIRYKNIASNAIPASAKYAVYFLHFQPEYTSDALGKLFQDQRKLIANIAASLPSDTILVVKEHPTMIGLREPSYYSDILSSPNVFLVNHKVDSLELIDDSEIVFTIVGTPALEAMFIGKVAIMFAEYAFAETNTISLCTDLSQLKALVLQKIAETHEPRDVKRHSLALLAAKYSASRPGQIPIAEDLVTSFMDNASEHEILKHSFREEIKSRGMIN